MVRIRLDQDIKPVTEFKNNATEILEQMRATKRPLVLTKRGHSVAVLLEVAEYERLITELETLRAAHPGTKPPPRKHHAADNQVPLFEEPVEPPDESTREHQEEHHGESVD